MPKITGLDLSRLIDENRYQTRVIIISGYSDFEYAKQALRYRVSEYLVKPFLREDLEEALERILPGSTKGGERGESEEQGPSRDKYAAVSSVKAYIHENYSQDLSLDALGDAVNLHPVYLSRIFKEVTDVNLSAYIADVRMQKAAKLLDETDLKVHEVMDKLGYRKRQHFTKLFKEKYGMTPKEYRMMKWNPQGTGPGNGGVKNK